jgi:hypothetical protein
LRQARGWTRAEAAERLGVQPFTLQRVVAGLEFPPDPRKMARVYAGEPDGTRGGPAGRKVRGRGPGGDFGRIRSLAGVI